MADQGKGIVQGGMAAPRVVPMASVVGFVSVSNIVVSTMNTDTDIRRRGIAGSQD